MRGETREISIISRFEKLKHKSLLLSLSLIKNRWAEDRPTLFMFKYLRDRDRDMFAYAKHSELRNDVAEKRVQLNCEMVNVLLYTHFKNMH